MSVLTAFQPVQGQGQRLTANPTSASAVVGRGSNQFRVVVKAGGGDLYLYSYSSSNASAVRDAGLNDFCIFAGQATTFTKALGHDSIAYRTDAGATAAFSIIPGEGM